MPILPNFLGFLMNCLAVMNNRQATRVKLDSNWMFSRSGVILFGEKANGLMHRLADYSVPPGDNAVP
ncbi:hypothetical protein DEO72_LG2g3326 [Vigna unguiculata]|uniref:Uncharacterized protein n=1 Tax=Vigna unguiculata TaxID=3917 RepID=A0A4D6L3G9_VIGUN|nr:hypothetical protein DEO72_LG2g3326 [Vigna unguiculata]